MQLNSEWVSGFSSRARNGDANSNRGNRSDALVGGREARHLGERLHRAIRSRPEANEQRQGNRKRSRASRNLHRSLLCSFGLGKPTDCQHSDVVLLPKIFGSFGNVEGGLIAEIVNAIETEDLTGWTSRLHNAIGH